MVHFLFMVFSTILDYTDYKNALFPLNRLRCISGSCFVAGSADSSIYQKAVLVEKIYTKKSGGRNVLVLQVHD